MYIIPKSILLVLFPLLAYAQSGTPPGPAIGLRSPMYDYSCPTAGQGDPACYRYLRPDPALFEIKADPLNLSDAVWSMKLPPPTLSPSYVALFGTIIVTGEGLPVQIGIDSATVIHLDPTDMLAPVEGSDCPSSGTIRITQAGLFACVGPEPRRPDNTGWTWKRLAWSGSPSAMSLPPVPTAPCNSGSWVKNTEGSSDGQYIYTCSESGKATWALVPLPTTP